MNDESLLKKPMMIQRKTGKNSNTKYGNDVAAMRETIDR